MYEELIKEALEEDIAKGDITTDSIVPEDKKSIGVIKAKDNGVICGLDVAEEIFTSLGNVEFRKIVNDGYAVKKSQVIAEVKGDARAILKGERTALNYLQRLSGIATTASRYAEKIKDYNVKLLDTRKTTPGLRKLEKYAVKVGGGSNHRMNLNEMALIKDNHIEIAGSIKKAVELVKKQAPGKKIEVEVKSFEQLKEALQEDIDIIMLDNMSLDEIEKSVKIANKKVPIEVSGGVDLGNIEEIAAAGVDMISVGRLTHSVKSMDISLDIKDYVGSKK